MKFYSLSKHGILTGSLTLTFLIMMSTLAANKINEIEVLTEKYKGKYDYQEYPPLDEQNIPIVVLVVSLIMIIITSVMIMGIFKERHLYMIPWILIFIIAIIRQVIYYIHDVIGHYSLMLLLCFLFIIGVQILILSPIIILFDDIRCKDIEKKSNHESNHQQEAKSNWAAHLQSKY